MKEREQRRYILVGAKSEGTDKKFYGGVLTLSEGLVAYALKNGFEIDIINTLSASYEHKPIGDKIKIGISRTFEILKLLGTRTYDGVIIFSGAGLSFYEKIILSFISRLFFVPNLFFIVDGWFLENQKKSSLVKSWINVLLKIPTKLISSGANWNLFFKSLGVKENRIVTVHYWLPETFKLATKPKKADLESEVHFIFVGWMIKEKGVHEILDSLEFLLKKYSFKFSFVGGGPLLEIVREKIKTNTGWENQVYALGIVSNEELAKLFMTANVFVLPSYAEGFPMSLIEAMTNGLPAICSDVGGIADSLQPGINGFLVPPRQSKPLVDAMESYLTNPKMVNAHSIATLKIVKENHDPNRNCELLFKSLGKDSA